jgi:hypothetical protein
LHSSIAYRPPAEHEHDWWTAQHELAGIDPLVDITGRSIPSVAAVDITLLTTV